MLKRAFFYENPSQNPYATLALEEVMVERVQPDEIVLYLYTHADTVVIGRNQNAWAECRHEALLGDGGKVARRISGGGAVFHDIGNLNFSFVVGKESYDLHRQLGVILEAVRSFGIEAEFSGRNDITTDGRKFSGNAFCFRKTGAFHHGTILIRSSMDKISKYLAVSKDKIESKGIASVRSRVINLGDLNPEVTPQTMTKALYESFSKEYGTPQPYIVTPEIKLETQHLADRNATWDWQFGQSPKFDITFGTRFAWGGIEFNLTAKDAMITDARVFSDSIEPDLIEALPGALVGCPFYSGAMAQAVRNLLRTPEQQQIIDDIVSFIKEREY